MKKDWMDKLFDRWRHSKREQLCDLNMEKQLKVAYFDGMGEGLKKAKEVFSEENEQ